jgi:hypothetical protein
MPARDYSIPQGPRPSFARSDLKQTSVLSSCMSGRRKMRLQVQTDLYIDLDCNPQHKLIPCSAVYELEDRSKPSVSSF